jgi:hypothetical protein
MLQSFRSSATIRTICLLDLIYCNQFKRWRQFVRSRFSPSNPSKPKSKTIKPPGDNLSHASPAAPTYNPDNLSCNYGDYLSLKKPKDNLSSGGEGKNSGETGETWERRERRLLHHDNLSLLGSTGWWDDLDETCSMHVMWPMIHTVYCVCCVCIYLLACLP